MRWGTNARFRQAGVRRSVVEVMLAPRSAQGSVQRPPCKCLSSCGGRSRKPCLLQGPEDAHTWSWSELSPDVRAPQPRHPLHRALLSPNERPSSSAGAAYSISRRHTRIIVQLTDLGNREFVGRAMNAAGEEWREPANRWDHSGVFRSMRQQFQTDQYQRCS